MGSHGEETERKLEDVSGGEVSVEERPEWRGRAREEGGRRQEVGEDEDTVCEGVANVEASAEER